MNAGRSLASYNRSVKDPEAVGRLIDPLFDLSVHGELAEQI